MTKWLGLGSIPALMLSNYGFKQATALCTSAPSSRWAVQHLLGVLLAEDSLRRFTQRTEQGALPRAGAQPTLSFLALPPATACSTGPSLDWVSLFTNLLWIWSRPCTARCMLYVWSFQLDLSNVSALASPRRLAFWFDWWHPWPAQLAVLAGFTSNRLFCTQI